MIFFLKKILAKLGYIYEGDNSIKKNLHTTNDLEPVRRLNPL